ncbi:MAG: hypothetical protein HN348_27095 [Proteobacteria bacterium]|jgi:hypothetical protein|nr:hypothetical protein [Pseudomonadota bacterium]
MYFLGYVLAVKGGVSMDYVITVFKEGGPFVYLLLLLFMLGPIPAVIVGLLACVRLRVPGVLYLVVPVMMIGVGSLGTVIGVSMAMDALVLCSPEIRSTLAAVGWSIAHYTDLSGAFGAGLLLLFSSVLAAVGVVVGAGKEAKFLPLHGIPSLVVGGLAAIAALVLAVLSEASFMPGLACGVGAVAVAVSGLRWSTDEKDGGRVAEGRLIVGLCAFLAVVCLSYVAWLNGDIMMYDAMAKASAEMRMTLMSMGHSASTGALTVGLVASLGCLFAATIPIAFSASRLLNVWGGISLTMVAGVLVLVLGVRVVQLVKLAPLHEVVTGGVITEIEVKGLPTGKDMEGFVQSGSGLGSCLVTLEGPRTMGRLVYPSIPDNSWEPALCPREPGPFQPLGEDETVLVAVAGRQPARWLASTQWYQDGEGSLNVLTDPSPEARLQTPPKLRASSYESMYFDWQAKQPKTQLLEVRREEPGHVEPLAALLDSVFAEVDNQSGDFVLLDSPNGTIAWVNGQFHPVQTQGVLKKLLPNHDDPLDVFFYPGRKWTIDDVVALCGSARGDNRIGCVIREETPAEWASNSGIELPF